MTYPTNPDFDFGIRDPVHSVYLAQNICSRLHGVRRVRHFAESRYPVLSIFKYLHSRDAAYFTTHETVRLATLASYARQDSRCGVGDPNEILVTTSAFELADSGAPESQRIVDNLRCLGLMNLRPGHLGAKFGPCRVGRSNRYIQCFATEFSEIDLKKWGELEGYDACLEIVDVIAYIRLIQRADFLGGRLLCGPPETTQEVVGGALDDVLYAEHPFDLGKCDFTSFCFYKDSSFAWQKEVRVSWPLAVAADTPPYTLTVPGLANCIRRIA